MYRRSGDAGMGDTKYEMKIPLGGRRNILFQVNAVLVTTHPKRVQSEGQSRGGGGGVVCPGADVVCSSVHCDVQHMEAKLPLNSEPTEDCAKVTHKIVQNNGMKGKMGVSEGGVGEGVVE